MAVVLTEKVSLGRGIGGYRFKIEKQDSSDNKIYEAGKRFEAMVRSQKPAGNSEPAANRQE